MPERPYTLTAELTYRCPLQCAYCSNPISYDNRPALRTEQWRRLFSEAEAMGVMQVNLTGGEPLLRNDLERLIAPSETRRAGSDVAPRSAPTDRLARDGESVARRACKGFRRPLGLEIRLLLQ